MIPLVGVLPQCGSCWAFSAVAAIESAYAIATTQLLKLSEQQLVDCMFPGTDDACKGGWPSSAFGNIYSSGGIMEATQYPRPYGGAVRTCDLDPTRVAVQLSGFTEVSAGNEEELMKVCHNVQCTGVGGCCMYGLKGGACLEAAGGAAAAGQ